MSGEFINVRLCAKHYQTNAIIAVWEHEMNPAALQYRFAECLLGIGIYIFELTKVIEFAICDYILFHCCKKLVVNR